MKQAMKSRLTIIAFLLWPLLSGAALAADPLREQAKGRFEPIPQAPPALAGNPRRRRSWRSGQCCISIRGCRKITTSAAAPVTTSGWAASAVRRLQGPYRRARRP